MPLPDLPKQLTLCHPWHGKLSDCGYPLKKVGKKWVRYHRLLWASTFGPIPPGLCVCHLCDNRACVNLDHLFLATHQENVQDAVRKGRMKGGKPGRRHSRLAACRRGHPLEGPNILVRSNGEHRCKICHDAERARYNARRRETRRRWESLLPSLLPPRPGRR